MNTLLSKHVKQQGIGLIEVLITTVVVAVGLLAVASMQGAFMSSSGDLKARSEAIKLAEAKIEEMRNHAIQADYTALASSADPESITGINAVFSRSWVVTTPVGGPDRRNVSVAVLWGGGGPDESVNLVSQIAWTDVGKASDYATGGNGLAGKAPSPNNVSSIVSNVKFNSDSISETALNDGSGLSKYTDENGDIYLLKSIEEDDEGSNLQAVIKLQGGVILSIKGAVYAGTVGSGNSPTVTLTPTATYPIAFSDLAYCVFPVPGTISNYICYFGGDCKFGGTGCPDDIDDFKAVQGGWYGKVGLTETSSANFQNKKICFGEDVAGTGIETAATTARTYVTRRVDASNNVIGSEGINQSFECQNFLIVDKRGSSYPCSSFSDFTIPNTNSKLAIASSSMERVLTPGQQNQVLDTDDSQCGMTSKYVVTGTITGTQREQVKVLIDRNACLISVTNNIYSYICTIETTASEVMVTAFGGSVSPATQTINLTSAQLTGAELIAGGQGQTGNCETPWGEIVNNTSSVTAYEEALVLEGNECVSEDRVCNNGTLSGSFVFESCSVDDAGSCVAPWGEIIPNNGTATAYQSASVISPEICYSEERSCTNGTLSGSYLHASCSVEQAPSQCNVTVSGNINKGGESGAKNVTHNSVTITANTNSCSKNTTSNDIGSYVCDLNNLSDGSTIAISGTYVSGGSSVVVDCASQANVTITGPDLLTIK